MTADTRQRLQVVSPPSARPSVSNGEAHTVDARLNGRPLGSNTGTQLDLGWVDAVRVNTSAVERRVTTLMARRTVKKDC
jgi:deoxyribose-phosphate aldolase